MTISTSEEFFAVLCRSKLLEPEQLAEADSIAGECDDAKSAAKALVNAELITRWQAGQLLAGRGSFFLGKYKLIELLGRGGMGSVFLGRHVTMNRSVALKIVSRQVGKDPASLERFLAEARTIAALDHPNIVQAYSVDNEGDRYYIVMEFIDGLDLQQMVETEGPLDFDTAADYIRQAAEGIHHGHQRNIVHCDIKPSNLLVNRHGVVKIVDMGLALLSGEEKHKENNHDDGVLGSVDYLAPEQALRARDFDHRADIYSLGCTLYFLLTGRPPFHEGLLHERLMRHQTQEPESIAGLRGDVPAELARICRKMMAKNPADRFQSAEEVGLALGAWQHPMQELKRAAPLKRAEALDETDEVDSKSDDVAAAEDTTEGIDLFGTLRRKIVAAVTAVAAIVLLAATIIYFLCCGHETVETTEDKIHDTFISEPVVYTEADDEESQWPEIPDTGLWEPPDDKSAVKKPPADKPPVEKPPVEKPKPKPAKKNPFSNLVQTATLPLLDKSDALGSPVPLGTLILEPDVPVDIELLGGENAVMEPETFIMQHIGDDNCWIVQLVAKTEDGELARRTDVARISLDEQTLNFQWLEGAVPSWANHLRNCGLKITVDGKSRWLPLTTPCKVEPIVLDLDRGFRRVKLPGERLPEPDTLRLQITSLEGSFPKHEFKPSKIALPKEKIDVVFPQTQLPNFTLHLLFDVRSHMTRVELSATYQMAGQSPRRFKSKGAAKLAAAAMTMQQQLKTMLTKIPKKDKRYEAVQEQLDTIAIGLNKLDAMNKLYQSVHNVGKVHFRVFTVVDDEHNVVLFETL